MFNMRTIKPSHLSVFALDRINGNPIPRMPFYAEVSAAIQVRQIDIDTAISTTLDEQIYQHDFPDRTRSTTIVFRKIIQTTIDSQYLAQLTEPEKSELVRRIIERAAANLQIQPQDLQDKDAEGLRGIYTEALQQLIDEGQLPSQNIQPARLVYPLGFLATDHVGYLSFDLSVLPEEIWLSLQHVQIPRQAAGIDQPLLSIWLYPMGKEEDRIDVLVHGRISEKVILAKLEIARPNIGDDLRVLALPAMQRPGLVDWHLSPASFGNVPYAFVGEDGCETLMPANIATREYYFNQIIKTSESIAEVSVIPDTRVLTGWVDYYKISWYPIGHSLGQINYSLALAPAESVNIAIVDWSRMDEASRQEDLSLSEELRHKQTRDRDIDESVNAATSEWQRGGSVSGGVGVNVGVVSFGLGGGYSTSSGNRDIRDEMVQKLTDNINQTSTAQRRLNSTVVIQSRQKEDEKVQTRTVVNYNHSHALTILYYEVLRHFRVVTEYTYSQNILLIPYNNAIFDEDSALDNRAELETVLLNKGLASCFEILHKKKCSALNLEREKQRQAEVGVPSDNNLLGNMLVRISVGNRRPTQQHIFFDIITKTGQTIRCLVEQHSYLKDVSNTISMTYLYSINCELNGFSLENNPPEIVMKENAEQFVIIKPEVALSWGNVASIKIRSQSINAPRNGNWPMGTPFDISEVNFDTSAILANWNMVHKTYNPAQVIEGDGELVFPVIPFVAPITSADDKLTDDERCCINDLLKHLNKNRTYYRRALALAEDPDDRAIRLDTITVIENNETHTLLELIENHPIAVLGQHLVFPTSRTPAQKRQSNKNKPAEVLISFPTRGVFAEAKLGHCNASEEIDNTRFWDWQQSPIPHMASEISPVQVVVPQSKDPNVDPSTLPPSIVNIVPPPAAPDPTGMSAALNALTASNIFRDMSGRQETAELLKTVSENSFKLAQMANNANNNQPNMGGNTKPTGGGSNDSNHIPATPTLQSQQLTPEQRESQNLDNQEKKMDLGDRMSPDNKKKLHEDVVQNATKKKILWTIVFSSEWTGEIIQPMLANYSGSLLFGSLLDDYASLPDHFTDEEVIWQVEHEKSPISVTFRVNQIKAPDAGFQVVVPSMEVEGLHIKATTLELPLRQQGAGIIPTDLKYTISKLLTDPKKPQLSFKGTGTLKVKAIDITLKVNASGEISGGWEEGLQGEGNVELVKLTVSGKMTRAIKVALGAEAGIKATFEFVYLAGYEVKQL